MYPRDPEEKEYFDILLEIAKPNPRV